MLSREVLIASVASASASLQRVSHDNEGVWFASRSVIAEMLASALETNTSVFVRAGSIQRPAGSTANTRSTRVSHSPSTLPLGRAPKRRANVGR
ncbi:unannotated protein [freshwater metagenome]